MELYQRPFRLNNNKIPYLIPGGPLIGRFLGEEEEKEPASQMWIASMLPCGLAGSPDSRSHVCMEDGGGCLAELVEAQPERYLGEAFFKRFGANTGFLLKLLNSRDRLLVQAHPDKEKAKRYFGHPFGKTEAWYVLDIEKGKRAYIWAGFKPGVEQKGFCALIEAQDCGKILDCLHQFEIHAGDVVFIPAGLPHALGSSSLVAEIQEPTDITLRAERFRPDGSELPEEFLHSGIGMEGLLDCFDFRTMSWQDTRKKIFLPGAVRCEAGGRIRSLIDRNTVGCFGMSEIECCGTLAGKKEGFAAGLVLEGYGALEFGQGMKIPLKKGTEFFIPWGVSEYRYVADEKLKVLECYPPVV